ncbi:MAG TPA: formyltransferase family protein [Bdellovibrionota bacterium]|jgi:phosphoribosylglycinamide formyltransferase-1|nr:formyltransferase family protein [Bdellovibrionota bacterium]
MAEAVRPWILVSSSSGETFRALHSKISPSTREALIGYYADRPSPGVAVAQDLLGAPKAHQYPKAEFEARLIRERAAMPEDLMVVLCGYKAILSAKFLEELRAPVLNLHPSLLPAFPGLDHRVHEEAFAKVTVSGFTVHLVDDSVDGGPVLYQHPVYWGDLGTWQEGRDRVREAEQTYFAPLLDDLLRSNLSAADRTKASSELRGLYQITNPDLVRGLRHLR